MKILATAALCLMTATTARAATNLGALSGDQIVTFSYGAGPVDLVYDFKVTQPTKLSVVEADFTLGGALSTSLSVRGAAPDPTPPSSPPPSLLGLALTALAGIDDQLDATLAQIAVDTKNGDQDAADLLELKVQALTSQRESFLAELEAILSAPPPTFPLFAAFDANAPSLTQQSDALSDVLAAGDYALTLSGVATGPGGGSFRLAALPDGASGAGGVPEPAAWSLLIGGFGLAGASIRRRKTGDAARA